MDLSWQPSDEPFRADYADFITRYPAYRRTASLDELRTREFARIDAVGCVYMDYGGAALYSERLVETHGAFLRQAILGNPHSRSLPSESARRLVEEAEDAVLDFFCAGPEYRVLFTNNASHAAKLVGESFPFSNDSVLLLTEDNHNSIVGLSCFARRAGAAVELAPLDPANMRLASNELDAKLRPTSGPSLLAYPAQSNFSGVKHSLEWLVLARARGYLTLLDAAALVSTSRLDLATAGPDFVVLSFYKMFGYPTGIGCLLAREAALAALHRPWFAGGGVVSASPWLGAHRAWDNEVRFEEGTVNYAGLAAIPTGLQLMQRTIDDVQCRVTLLTAWLLHELATLRHGNRRPLVTIHGPSDAESRGGTIAMTLRDPEGSVWSPARIEQLANDAGIAIRAGAHCNPGANEVATGVDREALRCLYQETTTELLETFLWRHERLVRGAVRVSLGMVSNFRDASTFVRFLRDLLDRNASGGP
jgi:molybdenum cofactor sulfurtransferase